MLPGRPHRNRRREADEAPKSYSRGELPPYIVTFVKVLVTTGGLVRELLLLGRETLAVEQVKKIENHILLVLVPPRWLPDHIVPALSQEPVTRANQQQGEGIWFIGMNCCEIKMLGVNGCGRLSNFGTSFGFSKLEVLYAAGSGIDDEGLRKIWQSSRWLLRLDLDGCLGVTAEGVRELVANSKGLKEISLKKCCNVGSDVVSWMVFSRPSLRKLIPSCDFVSTGKQREFFLRHGCWVLGTGPLALRNYAEVFRFHCT